MRRRSDSTMVVNSCPDCGLPQFHCRSGYVCVNGHGYGDPNGPAAMVAPTPPDFVDDAESPPDKQQSVMMGVDMGAGPDATILTVTWGKEGFSPIQFHTFEVGPYTASTTIRPGETMGQAAERLRRQLAGLVEAEFPRKLEEYLRRVRLAADGARSLKGGR